MLGTGTVKASKEQFPAWNWRDVGTGITSTVRHCETRKAHGIIGVSKQADRFRKDDLSWLRSNPRRQPAR